jgi:hypothetical protein
MLGVLQTFIHNIPLKKNIKELTVTQKYTALWTKVSNNVSHNINLQYVWAKFYGVK